MPQCNTYHCHIIPLNHNILAKVSQRAMYVLSGEKTISEVLVCDNVPTSLPSLTRTMRTLHSMYVSLLIVYLY